MRNHSMNEEICATEIHTHRHHHRKIDDKFVDLCVLRFLETATRSKSYMALE